MLVIKCSTVLLVVVLMSVVLNGDTHLTDGINNLDECPEGCRCPFPSTWTALSTRAAQASSPCLNCRPGFLLQSDGTCAPRCAPGSVFINQRCEPCPEHCAKCKDRNTCLECHSPALLAARGKCFVLAGGDSRSTAAHPSRNPKPIPHNNDRRPTPSLKLLVQSGQSIEFSAFTSEVEELIRSQRHLTVTLTVEPSHGKLFLMQANSYYQRKTLRQGDVLDLASFQQGRFVYQHDSSSLPNGEDLAGLFLASNLNRSSPFLVLYHLIFVIVAQLPPSVPVAPITAQAATQAAAATPVAAVERTDLFPLQDSPSTSTLPTLRVVEGGSIIISKDHLTIPPAATKIADQNQLIYILVNQPKFGTLRLESIALQNGDSITYPVLTGGKVKYESLSGAGSLPLQESISWDVTVIKSEAGEDKASADGPSPNANKDRIPNANGKSVTAARPNQGLVRKNAKEAAAKNPPIASQKLTLTIEPRNTSLPSIVINGELTVDESGIEILSPDIVSVDMSEDLIRQLGMKVVLDDPPQYGHLEVRDPTGTRKITLASSFPLTALLEEQLSYVQSRHLGIEPKSDAFRFYLTDGSHRSPSVELPVAIEDVNDEPPQITTYPLVMSATQSSLLFTADYVQIEDLDTDASDLSLTLMKLPSHGHLEKYDELSNSQEPLQLGSVFYYQDMLEGDITYASSSKAEYQDEFKLQISDGDSSEEAVIRVIRKGDENIQEYATTVPLIETTNSSSVADVETCLMQFRQSEMSVEENATFVQIPVLRTGETSITCSVLCSTRPASASSGDFDERPVVESSRIFFLRGVTTVFCSVRIKDDAFRENEEHFWVNLSNPQIEYGDSSSTSGSKSKRAAVGDLKELDVRIRDDEDITRVQFNQTAYHGQTNSPSNTTTIGVQLLRTGDLRFPSKVTVATKDGSAKAHQDYAPLSRSIEFKAGEASASIQLTLFVKSGWSKSFTFIVDPVGMANAQLGTVPVATVSVPPVQSTGPAVLPSEPIVVSLMHYGMLTDQVGPSVNKTIPAGYPVICVTPCDPKYPHYNTTHKFCQLMGVDVSKIRFSWEIAPPAVKSHPNGHQHPFALGAEAVEGAFRRLSQSTLFSSVEERVLDAVFFGPNFRVRCVAQPAIMAPDNVSIVAGTASRSRPVTISPTGTPCPPFNPDANGGQQPFKAVLSYVNSSDPLHPDTMKIQVQLPHHDGMIPILSTYPLHTIRYVLSEPVYRSHHQCSNLHPGFGFLDETAPRESRRKFPYEYSKSLRQESTVRLYRHLDFNTCLWSFEAWYKMSELVELCGGQVVSSPKVLVRGETMVTVRVPLHVAILTTGPGLDWSYVEHQTEMEFSFSYTSVLWHRGVDSKLALTTGPHITRIHSDANGRLIVEFQTETRFAGRYLLRHPTDPTAKTQLLAPSNLPHLGFHMELTWSQLQYSHASCLQKWRAISNYTLQDYTGVYSLVLVPCLRTEPSRSENPDRDCQPLDTINVSFPIHYQQPFRPQPVRYSLETTFQLTNNIRAFLRQPRSIDDIKEADSVGAFRLGESVYGRVLWNPSHDLSPGYQLRIEKLYLCAGRDGYTPAFEPSGDRPQYGCLENSPRLKYRLLLLDREDPHASDKTIQGIPLEAHFASHVDQLRPITQIASMDGFVLNVDPLFQLETGIRWFLQVSYSVQPVGVTRWRRQGGHGSEAGVSSWRHGTNMRLLRLAWHTDRASSMSNSHTTFVSTLIAVALLIMLVITALVSLSVYYRHPSRKRKVAAAARERKSSIPMKSLLNSNGPGPESEGIVMATLVAEESTLI